MSLGGTLVVSPLCLNIQKQALNVPMYDIGRSPFRVGYEIPRLKTSPVVTHQMKLIYSQNN
jgi:hypothetical protein